MDFSMGKSLPNITDLRSDSAQGVPWRYLRGGWAEGAGSVEALEFAEYERRLRKARPQRG